MKHLFSLRVSFILTIVTVLGLILISLDAQIAGVAVITFVAGFILRALTNKSTIRIMEVPVVVKPVVFPKPDQHVVGIVIDDSTSGRLYQIKSMNEFGLTWYIDQNSRIFVRQKMDNNPDDGATYTNWKAMGFFPHHAITEVRWSKLEKPE